MSETTFDYIIIGAGKAFAQVKGGPAQRAEDTEQNPQPPRI